MTNWNAQLLRQVGDADELRISSRRQDGTYSRPVIIWAVRVGDELYARSVHGETAWYRAVRNRGVGRISAGRHEVDVEFETPITDAPILDAVDKAYWEKYRRYGSIVPGCVNETARSATMRITPVE